MRIPQRAESWTHGPLSLATAQAARWPAVQPGQVPALICPLQRGTQHGKPAGPGAGTVAHPWSEILGTQQGTRSKVAKNSPPPFLGVPVGAPVECRQKGTVQPGTLIDVSGCGLQGEPDWAQMPPLPLTDLLALQKLHLLPIMCPLPRFSHP